MGFQEDFESDPSILFSKVAYDGRYKAGAPRMTVALPYQPAFAYLDNIEYSLLWYSSRSYDVAVPAKSGKYNIRSSDKK